MRGPKGYARVTGKVVWPLATSGSRTTNFDYRYCGLPDRFQSNGRITGTGSKTIYWGQTAFRKLISLGIPTPETNGTVKLPSFSEILDGNGKGFLY